MARIGEAVLTDAEKRAALGLPPLPEAEMEGSRFVKEPFDWHDQRFDTQERIMALQFGRSSGGWKRIEAMIEGLERRLWMTVYGVVAVILTQAVQSILEYAPEGGVT